MNKKVFFGIIAVAVLFFGGYFVLYRQDAVPVSVVDEQRNLSTTTTPIFNDISDWKTYRDDEYGFELKYPEDWNFITQVGFQSLSKEEVKEWGTSKNIVYTKIQAGKRNSYESFKNKSAYQIINVEMERELVIDGSKTIVVLFTPKEYPSNLEYYRYNIFIGDQKYSFDIRNENEISKSDIETFDQILSTFKFTK